MAALHLLFSLTVVAFALVIWASNDRSFGIDYENNTFVRDGEPFRFISGSIHYFRVPYQYWDDRLKKMAASGLNTVQIYVAWNVHEPSPGVYNFTGQQNISQFLTIAQSYNLSVLVRTGPYICAEWEYGGLPAWLLTDDPNIKVRTSDPIYIKRVDTWYDQLYSVLKPHLYKNGGNIIALQIENEYGSFYACDYNYLRFLRKKAIDSVGDDVVLYTVDGDGVGFLKCGTLEGLYTTVDFGITLNPEKNFQIQREWQPQGPLVNSEFYTGWLDHWGLNHSVTATEKVAYSLDLMLALGANVNMYMFEGGTNFGFWNGANQIPGGPCLPTTTSYDHDAPLTEAGDISVKYWAVRKIVSKYNPPPAMKVPPSTPKFAYGKVQMKGIGNFRISVANSEDPDQITLVVISMDTDQTGPRGPLITDLGPHCLPLWSSLYDYVVMGTKPVESIYPLTMEQIKHYYGFILYRHELLTDVINKTLDVSGIRDRGYIWLTLGPFMVPVGIVDRLGNTSVNVTAKKGQYLCILVENQGRINYGSQIDDNLKGLISNVSLSGTNLTKWEQYPVIVPNEDPFLNRLRRETRLSNSTGETIAPSIYGGTFMISGEPEDTYLDMSLWTKGQILVNGNNIGRYWPNKGPQVRLYVPKFFLRTGLNEVVMIELENSPCATPVNCTIDFMDQPLINRTVTPSENFYDMPIDYTRHLYH